VLNENPDQPVRVEGHTDNVPIKVSGWADNDALSLARAQAVVDYLVTKRGFNAGRLTAIGYGESRPITSNDTADGRQRNRRVELIILPQSSGASYKAEARRVSGSETSYEK
ncbi:MAG: OmpA family protein, partial [Candidatus Omnitrophica bacterium]|nr:OmpA family protein [Candidatus Omnitrophota bacterium]